MVNTIKSLKIKLKNTDKESVFFIKDKKKSIKISKKTKLFYIKTMDESEIYYPFSIIESVSYRSKWKFKDNWKFKEEEVRF